jgi:hypothetical protein
MPNETDLHNEHLADLRRGREDLLEQIKASQKTIERSRELIDQIDKLLAKSGLKTGE